ncbi:MAG: hypothetical protein IT379_31300, partial [Deltaproteobacteria bacterium]|nr:hypothetical protein [Deltaproteobacteria bacterium]
MAVLLLGCDSDSSGGTPARDAGFDGFVFTDSGADMARRDAGPPPPSGPDAGEGDAGDPRVCGPKDFCGDGLDNDCNGEADDECPCEPGSEQRCYGGHPSEAGRGVCAYGMQTCSGGVGDEFGFWGECEGDRGPQPVRCGGMMDWGCNGIIDEGCPCTPGETQACYTGPDGTADVGTCRAGTQTCEAMGDTAAFGACEGEVLPEPDRCDGTDTDCDGVPNTGCDCVVGETRGCYSGPPATAGVGICREGTQECIAGAEG